LTCGEAKEIAFAFLFLPDLIKRAINAVPQPFGHFTRSNDMKKKLGRPKSLKNTVRTTINLEKSLLDQIILQAAKKGESVSSYIRDFLTHNLLPNSTKRIESK